MTEEIEAVLIVSGCYSTCGYCDRQTLPRFSTHELISGYGPQGRPGCGARFVAVTTDILFRYDTPYAESVIADTKKIRPDLPFLTHDESLRYPNKSRARLATQAPQAPPAQKEETE